MPDPINYLSMIQPVNIAESLGQGLQVGEALHDRFKVRPDAEAYQKAAHTLAITAAADKIRQQRSISRTSRTSSRTRRPKAIGVCSWPIRSSMRR
jgi:hypothetical protein